MKFVMHTLALLVVSGFACESAAHAQAAEAPREVSQNSAEPLGFNKHIRPILAENCFQCHGPDSASRKADLRLDQRDAAIDAAAITPGKPDESELIRRILSEDDGEVMPPASTKKSLTAEQKQTLVRWITEGARYELHWSLIPPVRPEPPDVQQANWVRNPIDNFILARLEAAGLAPAAQADRRTLIRRLSLDLIGLPPDPQRVEAFVNDSDPNAYEKLVDELLASKHWGEHRGRYWLDAARYADTHGIHFDNFREMWSYRDWVINAFNRNLPFDQFTIEQLAGDLLPERTLDQQIASGFNRCNITTNEGGIIDEEYLVLYARDRTETTSLVWMGLTAGCAVCHDHKFDPLSQREFYELAAYFNNTTQKAKDGNIEDTPPVVAVPLAQDRGRWQELATEVPQARQAVEARKQAAKPDFDTWLAAATAESVLGAAPHEGLHLHAGMDEGTGQALEATIDGKPRSIALEKPPAWEAGHVAAQALTIEPQPQIELADAGNFEKDQSFSCAVWLKFSENRNGAVVARMDDQHDFRGWDLWAEGGRVGCHIINTWPGDALKVVSKEPVEAGKWTHVCFTYNGTAKAEGVKVYINGVAQATNVTADALQSTIRTDVPLKIGQRHSTSRLNGLALQDLRIYSRALSEGDVALLAQSTRMASLIAKSAEERTEAERNELFEFWLPAFDAGYQQLAAAANALEQEQARIKSRGTVAHVMQEEQDAAMAYVLFRGEYDERRDQVTASTPDALPAMPAEFPNNRLGLARWLLLPEHPLTARVTVNRFWQQVFGAGLVRTAGDFGITGEPPTHPALLDWLAVDFRESGWDMKRYFKQLVMSATYRQAAVTTPAKLAADADNRLLSRGPRFRMDAEMVRDYALAAGGLLSPKIGGPSVKPYQPEGVWEAVAMIGSNTRNYTRDSGESLYRRSMYTLWKRSAPPASMQIFDAPSREFCTVRRDRTNTPLQALVTLNDPQFVEAARHLAEQALKSGGDSDAEKVDFIARRLLARTFEPREREVVDASLADLLAYYEAHADDAAKLVDVGETQADPALDVPKLAAWTMLVNELMNLDEVLNK